MDRLHVCMYVRLQGCWGLLWMCRIVPFQFLFDVTQEPSPSPRAGSLDSTLGPRIGTCHPTDQSLLLHGLVCALPAAH